MIDCPVCKGADAQCPSCHGAGNAPRIDRRGPTCLSCKAPITWARTSSGKRIPLNTAIDPNGKLVVVDGLVRPRLELDIQLGRPGRTSHFATCPDAASWRR